MVKPNIGLAFTDLVFQILFGVIISLTMMQTPESSLAVNVPEVQGKGRNEIESKTENITISMTVDGKIDFMNRKFSDVNEFKSVLVNTYRKAFMGIVNLRIDQKVDYQNFFELMATVKSGCPKAKINLIHHFKGE